MKPILNGFQRKYLRGLAHPLKSVVLIGQKGATDLVARALDEALNQHELVKIKFIEDKAKSEKKSLVEGLQKRTGAQLVGMIGHTAILYRRQADAEKRKIHLPTPPAGNSQAAAKP